MRAWSDTGSSPRISRSQRDSSTRMTILPRVRLLSTRGLTAASARHPWRTIAAWLITLVLAFGAIVTMLEFTSRPRSRPIESEQAYDLLAEQVPPGPPETRSSEVIIRSTSGLTVDQRFRRKVTELAEEIERRTASSRRTSTRRRTDARLAGPAPP